MLTKNNTAVEVVTIDCTEDRSNRRKRGARKTTIAAEMHVITQKRVPVKKMEPFMNVGAWFYNGQDSDAIEFVFPIQVGNAEDACSTYCDEASTSCEVNKFQISCNCKQGFDESKISQRSCDDFNECKDNATICNNKPDDCINTDGSYICKCSEGLYWDFSTNQCNDFPEDYFSKERKIALIFVGAVLGSLCIFLLIVVVVMHSRRKRYLENSMVEMDNEVASNNLQCEEIPCEDLSIYNDMKQSPCPKLIPGGLESVLKGDESNEPHPTGLNAELDRVQNVYGPIDVSNRTRDVGSRVQRVLGQTTYFENTAYNRSSIEY